MHAEMTNADGLRFSIVVII